MYLSMRLPGGNSHKLDQQAGNMSVDQTLKNDESKLAIAAIYHKYRNKIANKNSILIISVYKSNRKYIIFKDSPWWSAHLTAEYNANWNCWDHLTSCEITESLMAQTTYEEQGPNVGYIEVLLAALNNGRSILKY